MEFEYQKNILELHVFIESWLKGTIERTENIFQYFENELNDKFIIIHPSGEQQTKQKIVTDFWNAYGVQSKNFKIDIRNIKLLQETEDISIVKYEEWQTGTENSVRISTVIFNKINNNNTWLHLHETWVPSKYQNA